MRSFNSRKANTLKLFLQFVFQQLLFYLTFGVISLFLTSRFTEKTVKTRFSYYQVKLKLILIYLKLNEVCNLTVIYQGKKLKFKEINSSLLHLVQNYKDYMPGSNSSIEKISPSICSLLRNDLIQPLFDHVASV